MARPDWRELCSSSKAALWTVTTFPVVLEMFCFTAPRGSSWSDRLLVDC